MDTEAEIGVVSLQPKEPHGLPAATRARGEARNRSSVRVSRESQPCRHLGFRLLVPRTAREYAV